MVTFLKKLIKKFPELVASQVLSILSFGLNIAWFLIEESFQVEKAFIVLKILLIFAEIFFT